MSQPIKRHPALQPLSREHHHNLLLCWKIREGFKRNIPVERIKKYTNWFFETHILPHFEIEEKYIFTVLPAKDELVKKALSEHRRLRRLFQDNEEVTRSLNLIEEELESHVRFEERVLFNKIQQVATAQQWEEIEKRHKEVPTCGDWQDEFWV